MRRRIAVLAASLCLLLGMVVQAAPIVSFDGATLLNVEKLAPIAEIVEKAIRGGRTPGAVVLIGQGDKVVYRRAFGNRSIEPEKVPMTEDTIFDLASLTKPIATATAVMQLTEKGLLNIDAPARRYWPAFKAKGKRNITVRQLLTHYSGLRPDLSMRTNWAGYKTAMNKIVSERPVIPPGSGFIYSDINFEVLGELVRRVSGRSLDVYSAEHIFGPLGMRDTGFNPPLELRKRIAPTEYVNNRLLCGRPHDPACNRMGGVAGHAGLFSTADDLAIFARALLDGGKLNGIRILKQQTVEKMTAPQSPAGKKPRGLGWGIEPSFAAAKQVPEMGAYGHLGYTGTALWIDPATRTYVIVLTNRVHPDGKGDVKELRLEIKEAVANAFGRLSIASNRPSIGGSHEMSKESRGVLTGIDVLEGEGYSPLSGMKVGLITNHTGLNSIGRRTLDLLYKAPGVKLAAVFSPEHGLFGREDRKISSMKEPSTGLPVYSLYGDVRRPTDKMLDGLNALVFDIQDAGTRFYTYISTMGYAMEAAAKKGIEFYVLDRPNPINGSMVQGPVMDEDLKGFTAYFPMPVRHGMTVGELAEMFNVERKMGVKLHVIPMRGYRRDQWYDETGLQWVSPSPNLRSLTEEILYPGVALVEGANVSVGRGTGTPFEVLGAPWIDAEKLAGYLNGKGIAGVRFSPAEFTPVTDIYKGKLCRGVRIAVQDRQALDAASLGIGIVDALYRLYPKSFRIDQTLGLVGSREVLNAIKSGTEPSSVEAGWQPMLARFLSMRSRYLLY